MFCPRLAYFNPRTAWAMRLLLGAGFSQRIYFNPRTAWAMRLYTTGIERDLQLFQSTHRMSDATTPHRRLAAHLHISIHAPHERCDQRFQRFRRYHRDFNPRTAWAMRQLIRNLKMYRWFLSYFYNIESSTYLQQFPHISHNSGANLPGILCSLQVRTRIIIQRKRGIIRMENRP